MIVFEVVHGIPKRIYQSGRWTKTEEIDTDVSKILDEDKRMIYRQTKETLGLIAPVND